jgi:hypothetical protein
MRTFALFTIALLATSAFAQQDNKRGLVDGLPIVGDLLGGNGLLGGKNLHDVIVTYNDVIGRK